MMTSMWKNLVMLPCAVLMAISVSHATSVVVTPGSLSGYTYFPPAPSSTGGSSGGGDENVSTLQRCLWAPSAGDETVTVGELYDFDKDITLYYRMAGGDGGAGANGGGGGSSAILLNGAPVALGNGGDGGVKAVEKVGYIKIPKGSTLRFITGGGGGAGFSSGNISIGGGGGAGYKGGGGGGSLSGRSMAPADSPSVAGKGGGAVGGAAGVVSGGMAGTPGFDMQGGIGTFPNGSSAPIGVMGVPYNNSISYSDWSGLSKNFNLKFPAVPNRNGSPIGSGTESVLAFAGGGGMLGTGGSPLINLGFQNYRSGAFSQFTVSASDLYLNDNGGAWTFYNTYRYYFAVFSQFKTHNFDMALTRALPIPVNDGYLPIRSGAGSLPGQIITMFQAPVCGIFK